MWSLIKLVFFVAFLAAGYYVCTTVPVGGATIAEHARDVWRSREVQAKVRQVQSGVEDTLSAKLDRALNKGGSVGEREITDADKKRLEKMLQNEK
jgi:hypothetical protein